MMKLDKKMTLGKKALGLKPGWRAFDFEQPGEAEVPSDGGEVAVQVKPYDFRVVLLKGGK